MVGVHLTELRHHVLEGALVTRNRIRLRENVVHAKLVEVLLQFGDQDVAQRHRGCPDFSSDHLEAAGDSPCGLPHVIPVQGIVQACIRCEARHHRH